MQNNLFRKGLVFGIVFLFIGSYLIPNITGDTKTTENITTNENEPLSGCIKIESHPITKKEIARMKEKIGVSDPRKNYNIIIDGYGTGLAPPSEETYEHMINSVQMVDTMTSNVPLRSSFDLSSDPCFPIVRSQGGQGSCSAWAATYYASGFVIGKKHDWNQAYLGNNSQLLSPAWTYNKCNQGQDHGSFTSTNGYVMQTIGVCRWSQMPYNQYNYTDWGTENAWRDSPSYRIKKFYTIPYPYNDSDINTIKNVINNGFPVTISLDASSYNNFGSDEVLGSSAIEPYTNHANTIVGYDDTKMDAETGEIGAFKIVNSWGSRWGPNYDGFYWITYQAFKISSGLFIGYWFDILYTSSSPKLLGVWHLNPQCDRAAPVTLGIGDYNEAFSIRHPWWTNDINHLFPTFMCLDITEFMDTWAMNVSSFYLQIDDTATDGTITSFKVEYYENSYTPGSPSSISSESPDTPKNTPGYVTLDFFKISRVYIGSLNIHKTSWDISLATIPNTNVSINGKQTGPTSMFPWKISIDESNWAIWS